MKGRHLASVHLHIKSLNHVGLTWLLSRAVSGKMPSRRAERLAGKEPLGSSDDITRTALARLTTMNFLTPNGT